MDLLRFFRSADRANWYAVILMSTISGLAGGAILAIVNTAATRPEVDRAEPSADMRLVVLFVLAIAIYALSKFWSAMRTAEILELLVTGLRLRVCDKLRHAELEAVEGLDRSEAFTAITQEASRIASSGFLITNTAQQAIVLVAGAAVPGLVVAGRVRPVRRGRRLRRLADHQPPRVADAGDRQGYGKAESDVRSSERPALRIQGGQAE